MKERPIIFSGPMVRAILEGRKTQTRRPVKPQPPGQIQYLLGNEPWLPADKRTPLRLHCEEWGNLGPMELQPEIKPNKAGLRVRGTSIRCPYGAPRLWVRETWAWSGDKDYPEERRVADGEVWFRADGKYDNPAIRWRPSIHMPRWASRITLEVTGVRVERLQEISAADAIAEGVQVPCTPEGNPCLNLSERIDGHKLWKDPKNATADDWHTGYFALAWNQIYKPPFRWEDNPYVWVVEFPAHPERGKR